MTLFRLTHSIRSKQDHRLINLLNNSRFSLFGRKLFPRINLSRTIKPFSDVTDNTASILCNIRINIRKHFFCQLLTLFFDGMQFNPLHFCTISLNSYDDSFVMRPCEMLRPVAISGHLIVNPVIELGDRSF